MKAIIKTIVVSSIAAGLTSASAETVQWKTAQSGAFGTPANWNSERVPGSGDTAQFDAFYNTDGDFTITDNANRSFDAFNYLSDTMNRQSWANVTFDLGGSTWAVAGSWTQYTLGTYNNVTYSPTVTYQNGTINVSGDFLAPRGGAEYGGTTHISDCTVSAANMNFTGYGTQVRVDGGAKLTSTGTIGMPNGGGQLGTAIVSGTGTKVDCATFRVRQNQYDSAKKGGSVARIEMGALARMTASLEIGNTWTGISNVFCVANGGTAVVARASNNYGVRLGAGKEGYPNGFNRLEVSGAGSLMATTNANWICGDSTYSPNNLYRFSDGAQVDIAKGYLSVGWGGLNNGLIVEDAAKLRIAYTTTSYSEQGLEIGHGATSTNAYAIIRSGAVVDLADDAWLAVGGGLGNSGTESARSKGSCGCSLAMSNSTLRVAKGIRLGCGAESLSNRLVVAEGSSVTLNRVDGTAADGIWIGHLGKGGHEMTVEGAGTTLSTSNLSWTVGMSEGLFGNTLCLGDHASAALTNGWITLGRSSQGNRMIVEDGATLGIRNAGGSTVWKRMGLEIGRTAGASNNVCIVRNGASVTSPRDFAVRIGGGASTSQDAPTVDGGANCSLIVENGKVGATDKENYTDVTVNVGYRTTATNALLAVRGAKAKVLCHMLRFGEKARLEFRPGVTGFDEAPIEVLGAVAMTHAYDMTEELLPKMCVDVADWRPEKKSDLLLLKANAKAWGWSEASGAIMSNLVATATLDTHGREGYSLYLSASGDEIYLKCKPPRGMCVIVR